MEFWLKALAFGVSVGAYAPYAYAIAIRETVPKKATWIIWAFVDTIIFAAMWSQKEFSPLMLAYIVGSSGIILMSFVYGEKGWTREDRIVLRGAVLAMIAWYFASPNWAIAISVGAVALGSYPTMKVIWEDPSKDQLFPWCMWMLGGFFGILAIEQYTVSATLGPAGFFILQTAMVFSFFGKSLLARIRHT